MKNGIPKPQICEQDWRKMKPNEVGRVCQKCEKTLLDLSKFNWHQIKSIHSFSQVPVCAKYTKKQLEFWGQEVPLSVNRFNFFTRLLLFISFILKPQNQANSRLAEETLHSQIPIMPFIPSLFVSTTEPQTEAQLQDNFIKHNSQELNNQKLDNQGHNQQNDCQERAISNYSGDKIFEEDSVRIKGFILDSASEAFEAEILLVTVELPYLTTKPDRNGFFKFVLSKSSFDYQNDSLLFLVRRSGYENSYFRIDKKQIMSKEGIFQTYTGLKTEYSESSSAFYPAEPTFWKKFTNIILSPFRWLGRLFKKTNIP